MEWRRAVIIDFYKTGVQLFTKEHETDEPWGGYGANSFRIDGDVLAAFFRSLDIPFVGEQYHDAKGRQREDHSSLVVDRGDGSKNSWQVDKLWACVSCANVIHVRSQYEGDGRFEEFTFSGEFVVWWADEETPTP